MNGWYKISNSSTIGWVKKESTTYIDPNVKYEEQKQQKNNEQLLLNISFDMSLNNPSGLSLEQFKKVLTDSKDKYKTFENNAEYFYILKNNTILMDFLWQQLEFMKVHGEPQKLQEIKIIYLDMEHMIQTHTMEHIRLQVFLKVLI